MSYVVHLTAFSEDGYIGLDDKLPFKVPEDMQNFKALTQDALICMGFNTFQSIHDNYTKKGKDFLPGRKVTVVCSDDAKAVKRSTDFPVDNVLFVSQRMFSGLVHRNNRPIIVVGGAQLYQMFRPNLIIATKVHTKVVSDTDEVVVDTQDEKNPINRRKSDNKILIKYPFFNRLEKDWNALSFDTKTSSSGLDYTYIVYHPMH